jgi:uncharacterized protein (UPF0264 family)
MPGQVGLLASVANAAEVAAAVALSADIVDLKDPSQGALGAWPVAAVRAAVASIDGRCLSSATIGDLPMVADPLCAAARTMAETGVDIVKVGFFAPGDPRAIAGALAPVARLGARLVAVLMADQEPDLRLAPALAAAGFWGMMLDTADKRGGGLRHHLTDACLGRFVADGRGCGLVTGLAGSLQVPDIAPLIAIGPDYLGFRGALCAGDRTAGLDPGAVAAVRRAMVAAA